MSTRENVSKNRFLAVPDVKKIKQSCNYILLEAFLDLAASKFDYNAIHAIVDLVAKQGSAIQSPATSKSSY